MPTAMKILRAAAVALTLLVLPASAAATSWQVTNTSDPGSAGCNPGDCSLRAAIIAADGGAGSDTVVVPPGDYVLNSGALTIANGMQIIGSAGAGATTIDAHKASQVFSISSAAGSVTISGLTLQNGLLAAGGGAVGSVAVAPLTLSGDVFFANTTGGASGNGGAVRIHPTGSAALTVTNSTFTANAAGGVATGTAGSGTGLGGAIAFSPTSGTLSVSGSTFSQNTAGGNGGTGTSSGQGLGGAIWVTGAIATVASSSFAANRAGGNGGVGPSSAQGDGGALEFSGSTPAASLSVTASTFESNEAGGSAGSGAASGEGVGGGVEAAGEGGASAALVDDTFVENNANHGAGGGYASFLPSTLLNDTLSGNAATGGGSGGNIAVFEATTTLTNTIIDGGAATTGSNCFLSGGSLSSNGDNIEDTTPSQCKLGSAGDKVGVNPLLGVLQNNGGPARTQALLTGSPAIDAGDNGVCPATDERGVLRPAGAACDIGAFEVATPAVSTGQATALNSSGATLNGTFTNPDIASASVFYQYGATTGYGSQTPAQAIGPDTSKASFSALVSGLSAGTTYHFRAVVANAVGTVYGGDQTFKTQTFTHSTPATVAPLLKALALHPSKIRPYAGRGASLIAKSKSKSRGATIAYRDSEAARTTFTVQRPVRGYQVGRRCQAHRPAHHHGKLHRCTVYVSVGGFTHADAAGSNNLHFTGRATGKPLPVGRYRLRAVARNAAGQAGRALTASFTVVH